MDRRRAAGALLALAACFACSAAAPTASNQTALDLYEGAPEGCYYNFQHYGEGDRIMTNEPCLNCTCHNRMLMCYLRVCPFTKPIGQDCTVEKRADQCCPIVTCPDVPVDLLTSTSTSSPAEYGATGLGKQDKYGCSMNGKYFSEGSKVPPTPNKPCEHCYCIRNMTTCVMQECTLHVDGCTPIYHKDVCCPVRYSCDHSEDEIPLLDDMSTTVRPTPGFLLTTTTLSPVTQMTQDCVHNDQVIADGASITTEKACEHCYCMKGDIVCVVQECGAPMENEGKNCTSLPPREGQCCPDTYICEGDELVTEAPTQSSTTPLVETLTTLLPPRRTGDEGSGYRNEPNDNEVYTEAPGLPTSDSELEGSGEEIEPTKPTNTYEPLIPGKPIEPQEMSPDMEDQEQYIPVTPKATGEDTASTIKETDRTGIPDEDVEQETIEPEVYKPSTLAPIDREVDTTSEHDDNKLAQETISSTTVTESPQKITTESVESLNTVPDVVPQHEKDKLPELLSTTIVPGIVSEAEPPAFTTGESKIGTTDMPKDDILPEKESTEHDYRTTGPTIEKEITEKTQAPFESDDVTSDRSTSPASITTEEIEKLSTEPDHAQNTVAVNEDGYLYPHPSLDHKEKPITSDDRTTLADMISKEDELETYTHPTTPISLSQEIEISTTEPDKGLNTIPNEVDDESSSKASIDKTTLSFESKSTIAVEPQENDKKVPSITDSFTTLSEAQATRGDQFTITTEPSFRREDDISATTFKPKEESPSTTIKAEFIDEGLIPTSAHDEKIGTSSDISFDDDITTVIPEYYNKQEDTKETTTEASLDASITSERLPEKVSESTQKQEPEFLVTTERNIDVTAADIDKEPSRIPGEGDCLLSGVTYRNNSIVPSTNNCHTGCRCVSSIIKCDPILCSPPPDYMDNCQSIYDTPESCCPTYVCDHPKETIPPQSDNQMSETERPMQPPIIECQGDQCELSVPTKPSVEPSADCSSGNCVPVTEKKPETSECGLEGCGGLNQEPISAEQSTSNCLGADCKLQPTQGPETPTIACEGDNCKAIDSEKPVSCQNEDECKKIDSPPIQTIPCEGNGCDSNAVLPSQDSDVGLCKEDGCKPPVATSSDCEGDNCRRKDSPPVEHIPSGCIGNECVKESDTPNILASHHTSTESALPEETRKDEATEVKPTEPSVVPSEEKTTTIQLATEKEMTPTEKVPEEEIKTDAGMDDTSRLHDVPSNEPTVIDKDDEETMKISTVGDHVTKAPLEEYSSEPLDESYTKIPYDNDDINTQKTVSTQEPIVDELSTKMHDLEQTTKSQLSESPTQVPDASGDLTEQPMIEQHSTTIKILDDLEDHTYKTSLVETLTTKIPDVLDHTDEQSLIEKDTTQKPQITEEPALVEKDITNTVLEEAASDKPFNVNELTTLTPNVVKESTEEPLIIDQESTKLPETIEKKTDKPTLIEGDSTRKPDSDEKDKQTDKPISVEDESSKLPHIDEQLHTTDISSIVEIESTKMPEILKEHTDKPTLAIEEGTTSETAEKYTEKPILTGEPGTDVKYTDKPAFIEETSTKIGDDQIDIHTSQPDLDTETRTTTPKITVEKTIKPDIEDESIKQTDVIGDNTETESTDMPDIVTDITINNEDGIKEKPILVDEDLPEQPEKKPQESESTSKPSILEETTEKVHPVEDKTTIKPTEDQPIITDDQTKEPEVVDKDKIPPLIEKEPTDQPHIAPHSTGTPEVPETTKTPYYASETTVVDEDIVKSPSSPSSDSDKQSPEIVKQDKTTESPLEQDKTTESPLLHTVSELLPPLREGQQPTQEISEHLTTPEESISGQEVTKIPEMQSTTEIIEKTSKPEPDSITEEGEIYTDMPEHVSSVTPLPGTVSIEPQEGSPSEPSDSALEPAATETTSAPFEEDNNKSTETVAQVSDDVTKYESSTFMPMASQGQEIDSFPHEEQTLKPVPTLEDKVDEQGIKPSEHDSEVKDTPVMNVEPSTERLEPIEPEQPNVVPELSSKKPIASTDATTKVPEESYATDGYDSESKPDDIDKLSQTENPIVVDQDQSIKTSLSETKTPETPDLVTKLPVYIATEPQEKPADSDEMVKVEEEKTTESPISRKPDEPEIHVPVITEEPQIGSTVSGIPDTSTKSEQPEMQDTTKTPVEKTDDKESESSEAPNAETLSTTIKDQPSTESPTISEEIQTELPHIQISTDKSMSLVTELQPESGGTHAVVTDKVDTEPTIIDGYTKPSEQVTEKPEDAILMHETTTSKQLESSKSPDYTSGQPEHSETTPYLIELEEHTHKMEEEVSTTSRTDIDVETPAPSSEDTIKIQETITSELPMGIDSHKEDTSTASPLFVDDVTKSQPGEEITDSGPISENIPKEESETSTKQGEVVSETISEEQGETSTRRSEMASENIPEDELEKSTKLPETITESMPEEQSETTTKQAEISSTITRDEEKGETTTQQAEISSDKVLEDEKESTTKHTEIAADVIPEKETETSTKQADIVSENIPEQEVEASTKQAEIAPEKIPEEELETSTKNTEIISEMKPEEVESSTKHTEITDLTTPEIETLTEKAEIAPEKRPVDEDTTLTTLQPEIIPEHIPEQEGETSTKQAETTSEKVLDEEIETSTKQVETPSEISGEPQTTLSGPVAITVEPSYPEKTTIVPVPPVTDVEKATNEMDAIPLTEKDDSRRTTVAESDVTTPKVTTVKEDEILTPVTDDKPEEKPSTSEVVTPTATSELPKPPTEMQPTDEVTSPDEDGHFPPSGYGEPDYVEEDQAFGPGTCRYGGKVYVSAQQIPRDDPCDFCFCFRSDIICLQQSCPPPIHGCHEEPIQGFCCPRYECPVSMATTVNVTTTTTTTTTTLPPHFPTHSYKGAAQRRGCQIKGHTYKVGEVVRTASGPCLHCTCGGDGQMKCDPKACTPEPMLRQMIAAAVSSKRRR